jgi:hypothetical protein
VACPSHCHHAHAMVLHEPPCNLQFVLAPHFSIAGHYVLMLSSVCSPHVQRVQTCLSRYQGCHGVLIGRPSASTQYREPITGTLPSASPLYQQKRAILSNEVLGWRSSESMLLMNFNT